jgi:hypothetical protein
MCSCRFCSAERRTPAESRLRVRLVLVVAVLGAFELEGRVLDCDREVLGDTGLELVKDPRGVPVVEALVVNHNVRREHGKPRRYLSRVQVMHGTNVRLLEQVFAHGVQVESTRSRLEQHLDRLAKQQEASGQDEGSDDQRGDGIRPGPARERDDDRRHNHRKRSESIIAHFEERRSKIEIRAAAPGQHQQRGNVADEANDAE